MSIDFAIKHKLYRKNAIDLNESKLDNLPDFINNLTNIDWLDLGSNELTELDIRSPKLIHLYMSYNKLSNITLNCPELIYLNILELTIDSFKNLSLPKLKNIDTSYTKKQIHKLFGGGVSIIDTNDSIKFDKLCRKYDEEYENSYWEEYENSYWEEYENSYWKNKDKMAINDMF